MCNELVGIIRVVVCNMRGPALSKNLTTQGYQGCVGR